MKEMEKTVLTEQKKKKEFFDSFLDFIFNKLLGVRNFFLFIILFIAGGLIFGVPPFLYRNFKYKMISIPAFSYKDFIFNGMEVSLGGVLSAGYILLEVLVFWLLYQSFEPKNDLRSRRNSFDDGDEF